MSNSTHSLEILASQVVSVITKGSPLDHYSEDHGHVIYNFEEKSHRCPIAECQRDFSSKRNLVDHCRGHHQQTRPHICSYPDCGKSFLRPAHLLIHTRIHTGEKPFACPFEGCDKRWNQKSALKQHIRSHTGEKPFSCSAPFCGKKFSTSSSCKRHVLTHGQPELMAGLKKRKSPPTSDEEPQKSSRPALAEYRSVESDQKMAVQFLVN